LYNESAEGPIIPTPVVGVVGVLEQVARHATIQWQDGDRVVLIGGGSPSLGGSEYLAKIRGIIGGPPPALDLARERAVQHLVVDLIQSGVVRTAHDCSDGGLAVALAEMALASGFGIAARGTVSAGANGRLDEQWFGEAPSWVIVACVEADVAEIKQRCAAAKPEIECVELGQVGGNVIRLDETSISLDDARDRYNRALDHLS
jgi:phosphoribosylformylglycinamidine synthase